MLQLNHAKFVFSESLISSFLWLKGECLFKWHLSKERKNIWLSFYLHHKFKTVPISKYHLKVFFYIWHCLMKFEKEAHLWYTLQTGQGLQNVSIVGCVMKVWSNFGLFCFYCLDILFFPVSIYEYILQIKSNFAFK